jgi:hypothetical protein
MVAPQSDIDTIVVAIPMVVLLFAVLFRLDELVCRSPKGLRRGRQFCAWDENGVPICTDPKPGVYTVARRKH